MCEFLFCLRLATTILCPVKDQKLYSFSLNKISKFPYQMCRNVRKRTFGRERPAKIQSACAFSRSDQNLKRILDSLEYKNSSSGQRKLI